MHVADYPGDAGACNGSVKLKVVKLKVTQTIIWIPPVFATVSSTRPAGHADAAWGKLKVG